MVLVLILLVLLLTLIETSVKMWTVLTSNITCERVVIAHCYQCHIDVKVLSFLFLLLTECNSGGANHCCW
jgi:hypothetical protein